MLCLSLFWFSSFPQLSFYQGERPEILWQKDGKPIEPEEHDARVKTQYQVDEGLYVLQIQDAKPSDFGDYSVCVSNAVGKAKADVIVSQAKVEQTKEPVEQVEQREEVEEVEAQVSEVAQVAKKAAEEEQVVIEEAKTVQEPKKQVKEEIKEEVAPETKQAQKTKPKKQETSESSEEESSEEESSSEESSSEESSSEESSSEEESSEEESEEEKPAKKTKPKEAVEEAIVAETKKKAEKAPEEETKPEAKPETEEKSEEVSPKGKAPVIEGGLKAVTVNQGETIRLSCVIKGTTKCIIFGMMGCKQQHCCRTFSFCMSHFYSYVFLFFSMYCVSHMCMLWSGE